MGTGDDNSNNDDDRYLLFSNTNKSNYGPSSRIMITAIISLSFVVLLVALFHVYARCVIRRQARRREALRHLDLFRNSVIVSISEPPKTGLDPSVIAGLPVLVFKQTNPGNSIECSVCLSVVQDGERVRILPNCKHSFHVDCIDKWLGSNSTCPICRAEAEPRLVAESREGMVVAASGAPPSAPPFEGTSDGGGAQSLAKVNSTGSSSRLNSFRRILSRERSSRRIHNHQSCGQDEGYPDLERQ